MVLISSLISNFPNMQIIKYVLMTNKQVIVGMPWRRYYIPLSLIVEDEAYCFKDKVKNKSVMLTAAAHTPHLILWKTPNWHLPKYVPFAVSVSLRDVHF